MSIVKLSRDVSFALLGLCFVGFLVSFCSPYWYHQRKAFLGYEVHHGLWRMCDKWMDSCFNLVGTGLNSAYLKTTQALMCITLGLYIGALSCYSVWASHSANYIREHGVTKISIVAVGLFLGAGVFTALSVLVFGVKVPRRTTSNPFGWSFAVAVTSSGCAVIASLPILIILVMCGGRAASRDGRSSTAMRPVSTSASKHTGLRPPPARHQPQGQPAVRPGVPPTAPSYPYPTRTQGGMAPQVAGYVHVAQYPPRHSGYPPHQQGVQLQDFPPQEQPPPPYSQ